MKKQEGNPTHRAMARLLAELSAADAWAAQGDIDPGRIVVYGKTKGVTAVRASLPGAVAAAAIAEGLAQWEAAGARKTLRLTDLGQARAKRAAAPQGEDFRAQHGVVTTQPAAAGGAAALYNEQESPLAWLARRKDRDGNRFLTAAEFEAGERFRLDATRAQLLQRVTADWGEPIRRAAGQRDSGGLVGEVALDARRRLDRACAAVGADFAGLLIDVCAYLKGLEAVETERGWPPRSGKVVLKIALARLAAHYGLGDMAQGPARGRARHWGAPGYRPRA